MDSLFSLLQKLNISDLHDGHDALFLLVHSILTLQGFKLVGLAETKSNIQDNEFPSNWKHPNQDQQRIEQESLTTSSTSSSTHQSTSSPVDIWCFRYGHSDGSLTYVLKGLRLSSTLSLHAFVLEHDNLIFSLDMIVSDYINLANVNQIIRDGWKASQAIRAEKLSNLIDLITKQLSSKLVPQSKLNQISDKKMQSNEGLGQEDVQNNKDKNNNNNNNNNNNKRRLDPLRVGPSSRPPGFDYQDDEDDGSIGGIYYDPLSAGRPRIPQQPSYPPSSSSSSFYHYGDQDLFPGGRREISSPMGFDIPSGSQIGPHHPGFGPSVNDPYQGGVGMIPRRGGPGGVGSGGFGPGGLGPGGFGPGGLGPGGLGPGGVGPGGFGPGGVGPGGFGPGGLGPGGVGPGGLGPGTAPGGMGGIGAPDFVPPPRGARFDPFGPPRSSSVRDPDPDHQSPPGFDSMYS